MEKTKARKEDKECCKFKRVAKRGLFVQKVILEQRVQVDEGTSLWVCGRETSPTERKISTKTLE